MYYVWGKKYLDKDDESNKVEALSKAILALTATIIDKIYKIFFFVYKNHPN